MNGYFIDHPLNSYIASWKVSNDTHAFNSLAKGMYYPALIPFLQHFSTSQLFIMKTEDILLNPTGSFQKLARFLHIDPQFFEERHSITEDELLSNKQELANISSLLPTKYHHFHHHPHFHQKFEVEAKIDLPLKPPIVTDEPKLSTRYRLQKVYRRINNKLVELFDQSTAYFQPWVYDVDRG